jgi:gamma-glutamylcyclotransferase (GGCT)/AIG2-like uncharacterized protein YtfP
MHAHIGSARPGRAAALITQRGALFAYGTLQFPEILCVLLGRMPAARPASLAGWRPAALAGRGYPGLVPGTGTVTGLVLSGLTAGEIQVVDAYESGPYELREVTMSDGARVWTYVWTDPAAVLAYDWSKAQFAVEQITTFLELCRGWRESYELPGSA